MEKYLVKAKNCSYILPIQFRCIFFWSSVDFSYSSC